MDLLKQKIVTLGGGTGHSTLLRGLVKLNDPALITSIPGTWDSGGSSGRLRDERGVLPPGDILKCLMAFMNDDQAQVAQQLFNDRLKNIQGPLQGHSLGNLMISRMADSNHDFQGAIDDLMTLFQLRGRVIPVSTNDIELSAKTKKGDVISGEAQIDLRGENNKLTSEDSIVRIYLDTVADANPAAIEAIQDADKIIFAPGDLYTSILPHLLVNGIAEAIINSKAKIYLVLNIMTKVGETDNYKASDFLAMFAHYLDKPERIDVLLANDPAEIPKEILEIYASEQQELVEVDIAKCREIVPNLTVIEAKLWYYYKQAHLLRHDPEQISKIILQ